MAQGSDGPAWADGGAADQMWRGVGVFMFPVRASVTAAWHVWAETWKDAIFWRTQILFYVLKISWEQCITSQQKCYVFPENARNAR